MDTFKLDASAAQPPLRNCGNCAHRYSERMPQQLMPSLVCHRFPPQMVAVPVPEAPASALQLNRSEGVRYQFMAVFPIVQPQQFCHSHDLRSGDDLRSGNDESAPPPSKQ